ncbi:MAG: hypothetical protein JO043_12540 [Candidatus Eremiobacteraeota bacterium]|nr:hypothetical protein [Candidatus Eremiobacteraeota bacterium]
MPLSPVPALTHLRALSDDTGMIQHAFLDVPNRSTGYCVDDVARAFIVATQAASHPGLREEAVRLGRIYLSFLHDAQLPDGRFHNFMAYDRRWLDDAGSEDSFGRAVWALGFGVKRAPVESWRKVCREMLRRARRAIGAVTWIRARALCALGLSYAVSADEGDEDNAALLRLLAEGFRERLLAAPKGWRWFEGTLTYDNARLCEAPLRAGMALGDATFVDVGVTTLEFLERLCFEGDRFVPIGNRGWYTRGGERPRFDQQPLEAAAMVDAELAAFAATGDGARLQRATESFSWYLGKNDLHEPLVRGGGCCDGLAPDALNPNMGAESTLAYLSSAFALAEAHQASAAKSGSDARRNRRPERRPA